MKGLLILALICTLTEPKISGDAYSFDGDDYSWDRPAYSDWGYDTGQYPEKPKSDGWDDPKPADPK